MALGNINERYRLDAVIGSGAMGTVYRATHLENKEVFAVKHLKPELAIWIKQWDATRYLLDDLKSRLGGSL